MLSPVSRSNHPLSIIRLWPDQVKDAAFFDELLDALKRHPGSCDELWFCTEWNFPTLEAHSRLSDLTACAADKARASGIQPGLQIANTMGHGDSFIWFSIDGAKDFRRLVGHDGVTSTSCFCPRCPNLIAYYREASRIYSRWKPSSVWIDDDLRMNHHRPIDWGCFCVDCVQEFSKQSGIEYSRESLAAALNSRDGGKTRRDWTLFNEARMAGLASAIAEEFAAASPDTRMALQFCGTDWSLYNANNFAGVFRAMSQATGQPVGARPGAGFYADHAPRGMIAKAFSLGRSATDMPDCVDLVTPEVENFPHVAMSKSPHGTVIEASLDIALGCNSASFAAICFATEPMSYYESIFERIASYRPFWARCLDAWTGAYPGGLMAALGASPVEHPVEPTDKPFAWANVDLSPIYRLSAIGLPVTVDRRGACATIIHQNAVATFSDDELRRIIKGGVIMDGASALAIQTRGLGDELGMTVLEFPRKDCFERFTDDAINSDNAGAIWRASLIGAGAARYALSSANPKFRSLGVYEDFNGVVIGVAAAAIETSSGGRVVIFGRDPWETIISHALRARLLQVADWVSGGQLPVILETDAQAVVVPRVHPDGTLKSVFVLNASIDRSPSLSLTLRGALGTSGVWFTPDLPSQIIRLVDVPGGKAAQIPPLAGWSVGCLSV